MSDDNNNADFDETVGETHSALRPAPPMTRKEFTNKVVILALDLRYDHEEQTGVTDTELHDWEFWSTELTNAYLNSD